VLVRRQNGLVRWHPSGAPLVAAGCCCDNNCSDCDPCELCGEYELYSFSYIATIYENSDCNGTPTGTIEVSLDAPVTLSRTSGCSFSGSATMTEDGNSVDVAITISWFNDGGSCGWNIEIAGFSTVDVDTSFGGPEKDPSGTWNLAGTCTDGYSEGEYMTEEWDFVINDPCEEVGIVPCECPCDPWLPEEWPCGGLLEEYSLDSYVFKTRIFSSNDSCEGDHDYYYEMQLENPITLTATNEYETSCLWLGMGTFKERWSEDGAWITGIPGSWSVALFDQAWSVKGPGLEDAGTVKLVGNSPVGSYPGRTQCIPASSDSSQAFEAQGIIS
jgi:hypothetical protein